MSYQIKLAWGAAGGCVRPAGLAAQYLYRLSGIGLASTLICAIRSHGAKRKRNPIALATLLHLVAFPPSGSPLRGFSPSHLEPSVGMGFMVSLSLAWRSALLSSARRYGLCALSGLSLL